MDIQPKKILLRTSLRLAVPDAQEPAGPPPPVPPAAAVPPAAEPVTAPPAATAAEVVKRSRENLPIQMRRLEKKAILIPDDETATAAAAVSPAAAVPPPAPPRGSPVAAEPLAEAPPVSPVAGGPAPAAAPPPSAAAMRTTVRSAPGMRSAPGAWRPAVSAEPAEAPPAGGGGAGAGGLSVRRERVEIPAEIATAPARLPARPVLNAADLTALALSVLCVLGAFVLASVLPLVRAAATCGDFAWNRLAVEMAAPFLVILLVALRRQVLTLVVWVGVLLAAGGLLGLGAVLLLARSLLSLPPEEMALLPSSADALGAGLLLVGALWLLFGGGPVRFTCGLLAALLGATLPFAPVEDWAAEFFGDPKAGVGAAGAVMAEGEAERGVFSAGSRYTVALPLGWNVLASETRPSLVWAPATLETAFAREDGRLLVAVWREQPVAADDLEAFASTRLAIWRQQLRGGQGMTSGIPDKPDRRRVFALGEGEAVEELCVKDTTGGMFVLACRGPRETVQALRPELVQIFKAFTVVPVPAGRKPAGGPVPPAPPKAKP
ncbi:MAG: hypothetical protein WC708_12935 [Lentisphaeria bacterium]